MPLTSSNATRVLLTRCSVKDIGFKLLARRELPDQGLSLECLEIIAACCPKLNDLTITILTPPVEPLTPPKCGFTELETIKFYNIFIAGFELSNRGHLYVAQYISGMMNGIHELGLGWLDGRTW